MRWLVLTRCGQEFFKTSLGQPGGNGRRCILCAAVEHDLGHLLAACSAFDYEREEFLAAVGLEWKSTLQCSLPGDWPSAVLSPQQKMSHLIAAIRFIEAAADMLILIR